MSLGSSLVWSKELQTGLGGGGKRGHSQVLEADFSPLRPAPVLLPGAVSPYLGKYPTPTLGSLPSTALFPRDPSAAAERDHQLQ